MSFIFKPRVKKKKPALFFDLVGTLLDVAQPVGEVYSKMLKEYGIDSDPRLLQKNFMVIFEAMKKRPNGSIPKNGEDKAFWFELVSSVLKESRIQPSSFSVRSYFEELYFYYSKKEAWRPYPEVVSALEKMSSSGFSLFVASNWDNRARKVLSEWGMTQFFKDIFLSAELGIAKPSALFYNILLLKTKRYLDSFFFIEDDPQMKPPFDLGNYVYVLKRPEKNLFDFFYEISKKFN
ncbi:HAD hydrolase-like protein [Methylacidiphilum caldifontis]|uniref:Haloacid dehalogenase n=1 Tax=Methylacidiphilum caldifontis TaxID=2795386 RepID=A0A4Y8PEZ2_9BACT|nr:HAD hydrolase-like protein [Methylacidiphilum caldifontis]TFE70619.1 haloacid dehalogenase [Methylacidiphilum caldifontis]